MDRISLDGTWELTFGPQQCSGPIEPEHLGWHDWPTIPAQVPGNVELDLMAAGVLPDIAFGENIHQLRPLETYQWFYRRRFDSPPLAPGQRAQLVFDGLDCLGTVWLNRRKVGQTDNMLIPHRFDVTNVLNVAGENEIAVRIASAVLEGRKHLPEAVEHATGLCWEALNVRKASHMYGWDILPRLVSAGIWRSAGIEIVNPTRICDVYATAMRVDERARTADLLVQWNVVTDRPSTDDCIFRVELARNGKIAVAHSEPALCTHGRAVLAVCNADLWWPKGWGEPALYELSVSLLDSGGEELARHSQTVGLRTIKLIRTDVTSPEGDGQFQFVVNGQKLYARGTNWVPLDALHSRDSLNLQAAIDMLEDLNCNMVRCWGGNVYEDHAFFDLCDRRGILVWQDFALACATYPQNDDFCRRISDEAQTIVKRLRNHPSLALWAGNNENDEVFNWISSPVDPNSDRISRGVLDDVVRRLDPYRDYLPSSPYRGPELIRRGDESLKPEDHLWGPRGDFKGPFYTASNAHFVSEIGYHGCPDRLTLEQMMGEENVWPWQNNDHWRTRAVRPHPKCGIYDFRIELMARQIKILFPQVPSDLDDFIFASQITQAEALKFFVETWRLGKGRRTGMLWWNLRDGWPVISDAVVDYYNRPKLAYHYLKRVQADVCGMAGEAAGGAHPICAVNDTLADVAVRLEVSDADTHSVLLQTDAAVPANGIARAGEIPAPARPAMWIIKVSYPQKESLNHYLAGPRPFDLNICRAWLKKILPAQNMSG
ncbi:MAG: glycoside hydrolase family 2 [Planctomycetes bacterium]|nr:glycoside hydrolase family 2 [Planctomycetota bacterium]